MVPIYEATTDPAWDAAFGASKRAAIRTEALARRQLGHDEILPGWSTVWETFNSKERGAKLCDAGSTLDIRCLYDNAKYPHGLRLEGDGGPGSGDNADPKFITSVF